MAAIVPVAFKHHLFNLHLFPIFTDLLSTTQHLINILLLFNNNNKNNNFSIALIPAWWIDALYNKYNKCILININR